MNFFTFELLTLEAITDKWHVVPASKNRNKIKNPPLISLVGVTRRGWASLLAVVFIAVLLQFFYDPSVLGASLSLALGLLFVNDVMDKKGWGKSLPKSLPSSLPIYLRWALLLAVACLVIFSVIYNATTLDDGNWKYEVRDIFASYRQVLNLKYHGHFLFVALWLVGVARVKKKNSVLTIMLLLLAFGFLSVYQSVFDYLQNTGDEAMMEVKHFNFSEAASFLVTLGQNISFQFNLITTMVAILFAHVIAGVKNHIMGYYADDKHSIAKKTITAVHWFLLAVLIIMPLHRLYARSIMAFMRNLDFFETAKELYKNPLPPIDLPRVGLQLVVYIGESTSPIHWSLYGYQRATTPQLEKLAREGNLLVFHNVFSTFSHTGPSLLNALSFRPLSQSLFAPIDGQKRIPLPAVLADSNIINHYISTQAYGTSTDLLSITIFSKIKKILNNSLNDHQVLLAQLTGIVPSLKKNQSQVVWLHSYAGHAPYINSLPLNFVAPVDDFYKNQPLNNIIAQDGLKSTVREIEGYDSAMTYVDSNLSGAMKQVANLSTPVVVVYFADHGESPNYGLGHDSSRFRHEMFRVPFVIYFNQAAKDAYPQLFAKYQQLAAASRRRISLLNQFPYTVIDLLGGDIKKYSKAIAIKSVMGEQNNIIDPVMVRGTASGIKYVNLNRVAIPGAPAGTIDNTNDSHETTIFLQNFYGAKTCYRVVDIRSAMIGSFIAPCLLIDKAAAVTNPTLLSAIKTIARKRDVALQVK
ncbi:MAG: sulfatase-like hydrolase/transferase [Hydrotalea sp.]|nr:sulfatase-like hydrolase/transferase [Hydrotalea sp.]